MLTAYIGRNLSGYLIVYLFVLAVFFGPLVVSKIPDKYIESFKNGLQVLSKDEGSKTCAKAVCCIFYSVFITGIFSELELIPHISNNEANERDVDLDSLTDKTGGE